MSATRSLSSPHVCKRLRPHYDRCNTVRFRNLSSTCYAERLNTLLTQRKPQMSSLSTSRKIFWIFPGIPAFILLTRLQPVYAQFTSAQCTNEFGWMFNDKGDSPCTVAAYIQSLCYQDSGWFVPSLTPGQMYLPPTRDQVQRCTTLCNIVIYNLMSSCAACQERDWATYSDWAENCSSQDRDNASHVIITPSNTSVPSWALVDTSKGKGTFDLAVAYTVANHGSGSNPYAGGGGLAPAAIAGISVGVTAVIVIALMLLFYRRSPSLPSPGSPRSTSSKWRKLLRPRQSSSHSYEHVQGFQGPPPSPIIKARRTRVSSSVANSDFLIDKDSAEGPLTPRTEATESMGGVQGRLLALFGNRGRTSIQTADLGGARDFTFVSSASPTDAPGEPAGHHELESFLPRPESSQPRSRSGSTTRGRQTLYPSDSVSVVDIPVTVVDTDNQRRRSISPFLGEKSASSGDHKHSPQRSGAPSISTGSFVLYPPVAPATAPYGADLAAIYRS